MNEKIFGILVGIAAVITAVSGFIGVIVNTVETASAVRWLKGIGNKWDEKMGKIVDEMMD